MAGFAVVVDPDGVAPGDPDAAAFVAACTLNPNRDEMKIAQAIRSASRTAQPNARIVTIADRLLKRDGRMVRAVEQIGPGDMAMEGHPFRLDLE